MNGMLIEEIENLDRNFLTPAEVSKALGISIATFYRNYKKMKFPTTRVGSRLQIPKEAFLDFLRYGEFSKSIVSRQFLSEKCDFSELPGGEIVGAEG